MKCVWKCRLKNTVHFYRTRVWITSASVHPGITDVTARAPPGAARSRRAKMVALVMCNLTVTIARAALDSQGWTASARRTSARPTPVRMVSLRLQWRHMGVMSSWTTCLFRLTTKKFERSTLLASREAPQSPSNAVRLSTSWRHRGSHFDSSLSKQTPGWF